jgi:outer membrane scaffolding protein for murein synthesis (MipA/OmpV family)
MHPHSRHLALAAILCLAAVFAGGRSLAQETHPPAPPSLDAAGEPLWELGAVGVAGRLPHYRGSDAYDNRIVVFPFLIYRGEILRVDRDNLRGIFYKGNWGEADLSLSGYPPVERDPARRGMPDLDPYLEIGPAWRIPLLRDAKGAPNLFLQTALRGVITLDSHNLQPEYRGLLGEVSLRAVNIRPSPDFPARFGGALGIYLSDADYNSYFYNVSEAQALPSRPAYKSDAGYAGFFLSSYMVRNITRSLSWSAYARWDNVSGAVFENSPLVRASNNFTLGATLSWTFAVSVEKASRDR